MTYNTKYKLPMRSKKGRRYELRLKKKDYKKGSEIFSLKAQSNPIRISDSSTTQDGKLLAVRGTSMTMRLVADTACLDSGFKEDFENILDRDWVSEFIEIKAGLTYRGYGKIVTLDLDAETIPAKGKVQITHIGSLSFTPECLLEFSMNIFPAVGETELLDLYATPAYESNQYPGRKHLGTVSVYATDTQEMVMQRIAANISGCVYLGGEEIMYTQLTYDTDIDSGWNVKITYMEDVSGAYWHNNWYRFNGSTQRHFIKMFWHSFSPTGEPTVTQVAVHYFKEGEYLELVANVLAANINGTNGYRIVQNVYFPISGQVKNIKIKALAVGTTVEMELLEVSAVEGNSIVIQEADINDTYLRIEKSQNADYEYITTDFTGGQDIGDVFALEIDKGTGWTAVASIMAIQGATSASIIASLVDKIDATLRYGAYIDPLDDSGFYVTHDAVTGMQYRFTTSGSSTLMDNGPDFEVIDQEIVKWVGWILPYFYDQPHLPGNVRVTLMAADGLGDIKNKEFPSDRRLNYRKVSFMEIISDILSMTGFSLDIYEAFHLWALYMDTTKSPLLQTYLDSSQVVGEDPNVLLNEIVSLLQATLAQKDGRWELIPIKLQEKTEYKYRVFDHLGNYKDSYTRKDFRVSAGGPTRDNIMINRATRFMYDEALSDVEYLQDYGYSSQLVAFPTFELFNDNFGGGGVWLYPWKWLYAGVNQTSFLGKIKKDPTGYVIIQDDSGQVNPLYMAQKVIIADIPRNTDKKQYELQLHIKGTQDMDDAADFFRFKIAVTGGSIPLFMENDPAFPWTPVDSIIEIDVKENDTDIVWKMPFPMPEPLASQGGEFDMEIQVLQPSAGEGWVGIKFAKVYIRSEMDKSQVTESYYEDRAQITGRKLKLQKRIGDVPNVLGASQMYHYALYWMNKGKPQLTQSWREKGSDADGIPILTASQRFALAQYAVPPTHLQTNLFGNADMRSVIQDKSDFDYLYMVVSGTWHPMLDELHAELSQIRLSDLNKFPTEVITDGGNQVTSIKPYVDEPSPKIEDLRRAYKELTGGFVGADLDASDQILIRHDLQKIIVVVVVYESGSPLVPHTDFSADPAGSNKQVTITILKAYTPTSKYTYRIY